jgi:transposase InsO family protein
VGTKDSTKEVLKICHDNTFAGHQGLNKTAEKLRKNFYWYQYKMHIRNYIARCITCNKAKNPARTPRAPLGQYNSAYPLDRLRIDIMGPLLLTKSGNRFILVIGDYLTRYMEAYALLSQTAEEVAKKLVFESICRYGIPLELHSDQGRSFESELFQELCCLLQIKKTRTTSYGLLQMAL